MQIQGPGIEHKTEMHQVTTCLHDHTQSAKRGGAAMSAQNLSQTEASVTELQQEGTFSLSAWLEKTFAGGKRFLLGLWGDNGVSVGEADPSTGNIADGKSVMSHQTLPDNGVIGQYFLPVEKNHTPNQRMREKILFRMKNIRRRLAGQAGEGATAEELSGRNSFQAKQGKPKEDLQKYSKYRKDDLEIECILTDDSYLLDSYNKKGEYHKLTATK